MYVIEDMTDTINHREEAKDMPRIQGMHFFRIRYHSI